MQKKYYIARMYFVRRIIKAITFFVFYFMRISQGKNMKFKR